MSKSKRSSSIAIIYTITFLVAFCSIAYELLLAHTISLVAASTVVWYGIVVGTFLGSLGIGSFLIGKLLKKNKAYPLLLKTEFALTFVGGIVALLVYFAHSINVFLITRGSAGIGTLVFIGLSLLAVIAVGLLSGIELPLLMKIGSREAQKDVSNRVLAIDYFGSLFGAIVFPVLLIPNMNVFMIGFVLACINLIAALLIVNFFYQKLIKKLAYLSSFVFLALFVTVGFLLSSGADMFFAKKYYYYIANSQNVRSLFLPLSDEPDIERIQSPYQVIDLVQLNEKGFYEDYIDLYTDPKCKNNTPYGDLALYLNGDWQLNIRTEKVYHEYFVHIPVMLSGKVPKKVLVLGGGDGMLDRELLKYDQVEQITHVDLDQKIIELASDGVLAEINENALLDEKVKIVIADGYSYVKNSKEIFDAIYIDFPTPVDYNLARLYSTEFYSFVRKRLNEEGFVAFDTPGANSVIESKDSNEIIFAQTDPVLSNYYDTIKYSGFDTVIPFMSMLEIDNEKALLVAKDIAMKRLSKRNEYNNQKIRNSFFHEQKAQREGEKNIKDFVDNLQEGFIFATKNKGKLIREYKKNEISLCFLNEKRFNLSLRVPFESTRTPDRKNVNSIMKPVLPLSEFSQVRIPYNFE